VVPQHRQGLHRPWGGGGGLHIVPASVVCFAGSPPWPGRTQKQPEARRGIGSLL
jgi:hypothetical protein